MRAVVSILILLIFPMLYSCEIVIDPPEAEFFVSRTWRMNRVQNAQIGVITEGLENYRLVLNDSTGRFLEDRTGLERIFGRDQLNCPQLDGTWSLNSTGTELVLRDPTCDEPDSLQRWAIIEIELRTLRLERILQDGKNGSYSLTYFLEAVPQ